MTGSRSSSRSKNSRGMFPACRPYEPHGYILAPLLPPPVPSLSFPSCSPSVQERAVHVHFSFWVLGTGSALANGCCPVGASFAHWFRCGRKLCKRIQKCLVLVCCWQLWCPSLTFSCFVSPWVYTCLESEWASAALNWRDSLILAASGWCHVNMQAGWVA